MPSGSSDLLLDTHALIWWMYDADALSGAARHAIGTGDRRVFVSAASVWEIATKYRLGRLPQAALLATSAESEIKSEEFLTLPIELRHAQAAGVLPEFHRDPFDRLLIAQAMSERLVLISNERLFDSYGVTRLW